LPGRYGIFLLTIHKKSYEKHGVKEYWIAAPLRHWVDVYVLKGKKFDLARHEEKKGLLQSTVLSGFQLDLKQMFDTTI